MKISVITPSHNPQHLSQAWDSLRAQTHRDFEWVVALNGEAVSAPLSELLAATDHRLRVYRLPHRFQGCIGAIKGTAFQLGTGEILLELDHDDLLHPMALQRCAEAFEDQSVTFVYSDCVDFSDPPGMQVTYYPIDRRAAWAADGWKFGQCEVPQGLRDLVRSDANMGHRLPYPLSFEPSALSLSLVYYAPNHLRAWRAGAYRASGHDMTLALGDDHELLVRTYLSGALKRIPEPLYFYRVGSSNTWAPKVSEIQVQSEATRDRYLAAARCSRSAAPWAPLRRPGGRTQSCRCPMACIRQDFAMAE